MWSVKREGLGPVPKEGENRGQKTIFLEKEEQRKKTFLGDLKKREVFGKRKNPPSIQKEAAKKKGPSL